MPEGSPNGVENDWLPDKGMGKADVFSIENLAEKKKNLLFVHFAYISWKKKKIFKRENILFLFEHIFPGFFLIKLFFHLNIESFVPSSGSINYTPAHLFH